jgi:hypothetical protein
LAAGAITAIGIATVTGVGIVSAQTSTTTAGQGLASKIAQRFNLKEADVQSVIDEDHTAHQAERQVRVQQRLDQAVKDGKLTQPQADQLKAKLQELADFAATLKDKTPEERRAAMKSKMAEMKQWLQSSGIPEEYWHIGPGGRGGHHMMFRNDMPSTTEQ